MYVHVVVAYGEDRPVTDILIRHALERRQSVEKMVRIKQTLIITPNLASKHQAFVHLHGRGCNN